MQEVAASAMNIRVQIASGLDKIKVSGVDIKSRLTLLKKSQIYSGRKALSFKCDGLLTQIKENKNLELASIESLAGTLNWGKNKYRGKLNIIWPKNGSGCELINELSLESYISSLLAKEMNTKWPIEALKAQAVAARTYAYHKISSRQVSRDHGFEAHYDIINSEKHQVNGSLKDETHKTASASKSTRGQILKLPNGQITPIFFHSKCGGRTLIPGQVWSHNVKGYQSVECPFCHKHGKKTWNLELETERLQDYLKTALVKYEGVQEASINKQRFTLVPDKNERSDLRFYFNNRHLSVSKSRLRAILGRTKLPSNNFVIHQKKNKFFVQGEGYGHGVGLCQFGALELAKRGYTYQQILAHYFPGHVLEKLY
jgi:stage II sporulation protein D